MRPTSHTLPIQPVTRQPAVAMAAFATSGVASGGGGGVGVMTGIGHGARSRKRISQDTLRRARGSR